MIKYHNCIILTRIRQNKSTKFLNLFPVSTKICIKCKNQEQSWCDWYKQLHYLKCSMRFASIFKLDCASHLFTRFIWNITNPQFSNVVSLKKGISKSRKRNNSLPQNLDYISIPKSVGIINFQRERERASKDPMFINFDSLTTKNNQNQNRSIFQRKWTIRKSG